MRDLQFAEALEGGERIAALLLLAGQSAHGRWQCLAAMAERLPLADASIDLVWSNAMLHWSADVAAVQNRLIALTRPSGGGRGDGWYGPVTAATVRAFQGSNGLPVTGRVDEATWNLLFSENARTFSASAIR